MPQQRNGMEIRTRASASGDCDVRAAEGAAPRFVGHAAVTGVRTAIGDPSSWGFYEEIAPGAFAGTLAQCDARFLVDHDSALLVARQSAGDLRLAEDAIGLLVDADLDLEVTYIRDLARNVEKRRITGMSFGFYVTDDEWSTITETKTDPKGVPYTATADLRIVRSVELLEASAVTFPAYTQTDAALRGLRTNPAALARREQMLKSAPLPPRTIGRALDLMAELREGKMLSQANVDLLQSILERLSLVEQSIDDADDALESAETDLAGLLGVPVPASPVSPMSPASPSSAPEMDPMMTDPTPRSAPYGSPAEQMRTIGVRYGLRF